MTLSKHTPAHDFWHPRVESQIRETMRVHSRWFVFRDDGDRHRCVNSLAKRIVGVIVAEVGAPIHERTTTTTS